MSGSALRGKDCEANWPASSVETKTQRIVFDQAIAPAVYSPPDTFTDFIRNSEAPFQDPAVASILTGGVVSVRSALVAAAQVDPASIDLGADGSPLAPRFDNSGGAAPVVGSTRGNGMPQWRVQWSNGDRNHVLFCDMGCALSVGARSVDIAALSQPLLVPPTGGEPAGGTITAALGTEALVTAEVAWRKGSATSAPQGMATFTQIGITNGANLVLFQRPPFARRVQPCPPVEVGGRWIFLSNVATPTGLTEPPAISNQRQTSWDVPGPAAGIAFLPTVPDTDSILSVIWEIGVR